MKQVINALFQNWKTTSAGLIMMTGSVVHLVFQLKAGTANENTWTIAVSTLVGGIGLLVAGDGSQSVQVQQKPTMNGTGTTRVVLESPKVTGQ